MPEKPPEKAFDQADFLNQIDKLLDDESTGKYFYWIPIAAAIKMGMSNQEAVVPVIVAVCRQVLKRLLEGTPEEKITEYLSQTIGYDERYCRMAIGQTRDCATLTAKMMKGEVTHQEAVSQLMTAKNADIRLVTAMLEMVQRTVRESNGKYTADQLAAMGPAEVPAVLLILHPIHWLITLALWPVLTFAFGFRWWVGLLLTVLYFLIATPLLGYISMRLEKK